MKYTSCCFGLPAFVTNALRGCVYAVAWAMLLMSFAHAVPAAGPEEAALQIGGRTLIVFRAPLGAFSATERAVSARARILRAFEQSGEGWTSVRPQESGIVVELDGKPMFVVVAGDVPVGGSLTVDGLAGQASRLLQKSWSEARETRDPQANLIALAKVSLALVLLAIALVLTWKALGWVRVRLMARLAARLESVSDAALSSRISPILLGIASRGCLLLAWSITLLALFVFLTYGLNQFALTRAIGEELFQAFANLILGSLRSAALAVPGLFVAVIIFLAAWVGTQFSTEVFRQVAAGRLRLGALDTHTAPVTRYIFNAALWLFALAMAYPYLPGAQTEAFKGLSVILGIMVSIGASGVVGQIASGVILVYTRALLVGEYVKIQECEGTVSAIGLFVTRLRTGLGEECALPNALVLSNVMRNYSRVTPGGAFVLDTDITIGYDTPWRQVHALLLSAVEPIAAIAKDPAPYVVQSALSDFYVAYKLVVVVRAESPSGRARVRSDLHASIQDAFNRHGVQIMSPNYEADPAQPKVVPESDWYLAPAARPMQGQ